MNQHSYNIELLITYCVDFMMMWFFLIESSSYIYICKHDVNFNTTHLRNDVVRVINAQHLLLDSSPNYLSKINVECRTKVG
jgi:hypothetical protein